MYHLWRNKMFSFLSEPVPTPTIAIFFSCPIHSVNSNYTWIKLINTFSLFLRFYSRAPEAEPADGYCRWMPRTPYYSLEGLEWEGRGLVSLYALQCCRSLSHEPVSISEGKIIFFNGEKILRLKHSSKCYNY